MSGMTTIFGYGDTEGDLSCHDRGDDDVLRGQTGFVVNEIYGDAGGALLDSARGGDDRIRGGSAPFNQLLGDAFAMEDRSRGGDDTLRGGDGATVNELLGDARSLSDHARGGDDRLVGGDGAFQNILVGDARMLADRARGGDDVIIGGGAGFNGTAGTVIGAINLMEGDADTISGSARGGDDVLRGNDAAIVNAMYGDALALTDRARGGDDTLFGSATTDLMFGDARDVGVGARTGRDLFVIAASGGQDTIGDFESGWDRLDLSRLGIMALSELAPEQTDGGLMLHFDDGSTLTLDGITALAHRDVIFG